MILEAFAVVDVLVLRDYVEERPRVSAAAAAAAAVAAVVAAAVAAAAVAAAAVAAAVAAVVVVAAAAAVAAAAVGALDEILADATEPEMVAQAVYLSVIVPTAWEDFEFLQE